MTAPTATTPTILLMAKDLLTALLMECLTAHGYAVSTPDPQWTEQPPTAPLALDLILAEVHAPYDAWMRTILTLRQQAIEPDIPLVLIGHAPPRQQHLAEGRVTWLEGGAPLTVIMTAITRWSRQIPDHAARISRRRLLDGGAHLP